MRTYLLLLVLLLAACDSFQPAPTITPTRALTGPTLEASPVVRGELPTDVPAGQFVGVNDPTAAAQPARGDLPPLVIGTSEAGSIKQTIQITVGEGRTLTGDLYALGDQRVPGLLMLAPDSSQWLDLPLRLQAAGFTVLVMNVDAATTGEDFSAMLRSLSEAGTVDPSSIGVIGAEGGADLALTGCAADLLCDVVALVSPTQQEPLLIAMQRYNPRAIFLAAGDQDAVSLAAVQAIQEYAQGEAALETGTGAGRGALLVQANQAVGDQLIDWLRGQFA
jgi:dienelactone hydrolase